MNIRNIAKTAIKKIEKKISALSSFKKIAKPPITGLPPKTISSCKNPEAMSDFALIKRL